MKNIVLIIGLIITLIILLSGCYTILKHPAAEENYTSHDYQADCVSCHADYNEYPYGYFYGQYPDYWWTTPRWGRYYAYPWWWDNYWYDASYDHSREQQNNNLSVRSAHGEKAVRRDVLRPPYIIGAPTLGRSTGLTGSSTDGGSTGSKTTTGQDTSGDKNQTNPSTDKKKEDDKENKKAPRRGGGRGR